MINHSNENTLLDDANSPEVNRQLLGRVSEDFVKLADHLKEAAYQIKKRGFSDYPLFVVSKLPMQVGSPLFKPGDLGNAYGYNASLVEEFEQRELIGKESIELFKENYKPTDEYACLFVMEDDFAGFIYIPYPID